MRFTISYEGNRLSSRIAQDYLESCGIEHHCATEGEIEVDPRVKQEHLSGLKKHFERYGITVVKNEKDVLVQRIKNLLREVAYGEEPMRTTLSYLLMSRLEFSYAHLAAVFEKRTCCSIERYLFLLKIERAKRLILEDRLSLKEISELLHYSSAGHLCKQFRKTTGLSVTMFRKIIGLRKKQY